MDVDTGMEKPEVWFGMPTLHIWEMFVFFLKQRGDIDETNVIYGS